METTEAEMTKSMRRNAKMDFQCRRQILDSPHSNLDIQIGRQIDNQIDRKADRYIDRYVGFYCPQDKVYVQWLRNFFFCKYEKQN